MITLTTRAAARVGELAGEMAEATGKELRIFIEGAGCSGLSYGFAFDEHRRGDTVVETGGLRILVDPQSAPYLHGATIDYVDDERGAGFVIDNPNEAGLGDGCGCGCSCG